MMNSAALAGALAAIAVVFGLSFRRGDWNVYRILLTGVVLSTGLSALISLTLVLAPQAQVQGMLFWLFGDLSAAHDPAPAWLVLALVLVLAQVLAPALNVLGLGEDKARALGVSVAPVQWTAFGCASLLFYRKS